MSVTPSHLFDLAVERHRQPWNWTLHCAALALFGLSLLAHSYLLLAASLILFGSGFLARDLDAVPANWWFRLVASGVAWEKNWSSLPWTWHKISRFGFAILLAGVTVWALWVREPATLGLLIGVAALAWVVVDNRNKSAGP